MQEFYKQKRAAISDVKRSPTRTLNTSLTKFNFEPKKTSTNFLPQVMKTEDDEDTEVKVPKPTKTSKLDGLPFSVLTMNIKMLSRQLQGMIMKVPIDQ